MTDVSVLDGEQQQLLAQWFPDLAVLENMSCGQVERHVLRCTTGSREVVVKAGGPRDGHMGREIRGHRLWAGPWHGIGACPQVLRADEAARLLVTTYLPGRLVEGDPAQDAPETYRQAGRLLRALHDQPATVDDGYATRVREQVLARLGSEHRIDPAAVDALRAEVERWPDEPTRLVPTHGDWQPRNWLVHDGRIVAIDLGRADLRPALTDWVRLAEQDFRRDPALAEAFVAGYGADLRVGAAWRRTAVENAVGTAVWAFQVGDEPFEAQGHRMIDRLLAT